MTTLTERLRELQEYEDNLTEADFWGGGSYAPALAVAQDLHALLVECEKLLKPDVTDCYDDIIAWRKNVDLMVTKLKQAGIV